MMFVRLKHSKQYSTELVLIIILKKVRNCQKKYIFKGNKMSETTKVIQKVKLK